MPAMIRGAEGVGTRMSATRALPRSETVLVIAKGQASDRGEWDCDVDGDIAERDGGDREGHEDRGEWNGGEVGGKSHGGGAMEVESHGEGESGLHQRGDKQQFECGECGTAPVRVNAGRAKRPAGRCVREMRGGADRAGVA